MSFSDPLIKSIIRKHLTYALINKKDEMVERYLHIISDALPRGEDTLEGNELDLFLELVDVLSPYVRAFPQVAAFFRNKHVKANMIVGIPYQRLAVSQKANFKKPETFDHARVERTYEFTPSQIRYLHS